MFKPIKLMPSWMPARTGIMLWPFILTGSSKIEAPCLHVHEQYHWDQAFRWGVIPWYLVYAFFALRFGTSSKHPLEKPAYAVQKRCHEQR